MKLSGELEYRIRYDVEHDLFHAQNVFNDEYIPPTFIEYVQKLEEKNKVLAQNLEDTEIINKALEKENAELKEKFLAIKKDDVRKVKLNECKTYEEKVEYLRQVTNYALFNDDISVMLWCFCQRGEIDTDQFTKAKEIIKQLMKATPYGSGKLATESYDKAEQFLKENA